LDDLDKYLNLFEIKEHRKELEMAAIVSEVQIVSSKRKKDLLDSSVKNDEISKVTSGLCSS
jgi:hypothetical protein